MSQTLINLLSGISEDLWPSLPDERYMLDCNLVLTCGACPEQYDVFFEGKNIGYLRLRHGRFYAEYVPTEEIVYVNHPKGDGIFDDDEREEELTKAIKAIVAKHTGIPEQIIVYLLNIETSETVGVYSTRELAETASLTIIDWRVSIKEMVLDAEPKGENQ